MNRKRTNPFRPILITLGVLAFLILFFFGPQLGCWWQLERVGRVPEGLTQATTEGRRTWLIAERTTWWGDPIDPKAFWTNKVVWNDDVAKDAAQRHGRFYPPIPTHLTNLIPAGLLERCSHTDIVPSPWSGGPDGGRITPFHSTDAEMAYWDWFWRHQPKPPSTLEHEQYEAAKDILLDRQPLIVNGFDHSTRRSPEERKKDEQSLKRRTREIGVPEEALDDEASFWAYVMKERAEYAARQKQLEPARRRSPEMADRFLEGFFVSLLVDPKYITEPLAPDQLKAANAWKIAYLQHLRREKTDESYIHAYLKAWNLTEADVFPEASSGSQPIDQVH